MWGVSMTQSVEQIKLMVEIATLYYNTGFTQEEIANELQITRQRVNRLLKEAQSNGIVQINVVNPLQSFEHLRRSLISLYGLKDAEISVLSDDMSPRFAGELGRAGSLAIGRHLQDASVIGIGWGTAVYELVHAFNNNGVGAGRAVVPLIGGLGDMAPHFHINWLAGQLAQKIGSSVQPLHAPYLVERPEIKLALLSDALLAKTIDLWSKLDLVITGIGVTISRSPLLYTSYFTNSHVLELEKAEIVGDICSNFFNADGEFYDWDVNERLIAITPEQLRKCPLVVAVAGGGSKFAAIQAALKGGTIDVLVTDYSTAERLCAR